MLPTHVVQPSAPHLGDLMLLLCKDKMFFLWVGGILHCSWLGDQNPSGPSPSSLENTRAEQCERDLKGHAVIFKTLWICISKCCFHKTVAIIYECLLCIRHCSRSKSHLIFTVTLQDICYYTHFAYKEESYQCGPGEGAEIWSLGDWKLRLGYSYWERPAGMIEVSSICEQKAELT